MLTRGQRTLYRCSQTSTNYIIHILQEDLQEDIIPSPEKDTIDNVDPNKEDSVPSPPNGGAATPLPSAEVTSKALDQSIPRERSNVYHLLNKKKVVFVSLDVNRRRELWNHLALHRYQPS